MTMKAAEWLEVVGREYLDEYVPAGGAAIKFLIADGNDLELIDELAEASRRRGYVTATVDAREMRIDKIEEIFWGVARQVRWQDLAAVVRRKGFSDLQWVVPAGTPETFEAIAEATAMARQTLENAMTSWLTANVFRDYHLSADFRMAMMFLCLEPMKSALPGATPLETSIIEWLNGELRLITAVRSAQIYQKIARHNARDLFVSLGHWVKSAGRPGVSVVIDARAIGVPTRAQAAAPSQWYSRAQVMDLYEVLRQFIDSMDETENTFITVVLPPALLSDPKRGMEAYRALHMRIVEEVRDRTQDNPFAALVRLSEER
jgi:hypothetical protein